MAPHASTTSLTPLNSASASASPNVPLNATNLFSGSKMVTLATRSSTEAPEAGVGREEAVVRACWRIVAEVEARLEVSGGETMAR